MKEWLNKHRNKQMNRRNDPKEDFEHYTKGQTPKRRTGIMMGTI